MIEIHYAIAPSAGRADVQAEAQSLLARVLSEHGADPADIVRDAYGKPRLPDGTIRFNLSHSADLVCLAVSDAEVGVDCELVRPIEYEKLARRFYSAGEQDAVFSSDDPLTAFFRVWTRKEAYVKMKGTGFTEGIRTADTSFLPAGCFDEYTYPLGDRIFLLTVCQEKR